MTPRTLKYGHDYISIGIDLLPSPRPDIPGYRDAEGRTDPIHVYTTERNTTLYGGEPFGNSHYFLRGYLSQLFREHVDFYAEQGL